MRKLFSSFFSISRILIVAEINNQFHNPFIHHVPNRFYTVDPNQYPKPGYETVPYTKRTRFILPPISLERDKGIKQFEELKQAYEGKILPPTHPDSVRVTNIVNNIIHALHRQVEKMRSENKNCCEYTGLRFVWLRMRRRLPPSLSHLDGLNWEALILNTPQPACQCFTGGKIVVTTTFIEHFTSDVEIATCIAHEVAHIVARHSAEKITKIMWVYVLNAVINLFVTFDFTKRMSPLVERLPFHRRFEMEADYIGLLLMASAGYDPRLVFKVYENAEKKSAMFADYVSLRHPPERKRVEALARPEIMEEALILYNDASARLGVAHIVARHGAERVTKIMWVYVLYFVLNLFVTIDFTKRVLPFVERLPFNRRFEMEADYIGLLLMASAGYDPRLAPEVIENAYKIEKFADYVSPYHPPGRKRAEALARPEIMEEALILYNDVSARG